MIIGITGTFGAGKGAVVDYLKQKGFTHYSASGFITEEIRRRDFPVSRDTMISVANDLRKTHGPGYIVASLFVRAQAAGGDAVIESIRTTGELEKLKNEKGFLLLAIDADPRVRYERSVKRGSEKDDVTFERFLAQEKTEMDSQGDPHKQNIKAIMAAADERIENNGTLDELHKKIEEMLSRIPQ